MAFFNRFMDDDYKRQTTDIVQDVVENMNNILNTKKDYGSLLRNFGIRDLNEFNDRDGMIDIIIKEVIRCIECYEPRVKIINVLKEAETDMFKLPFQIECVVQSNKQRMSMEFDTVYNNFFVENLT
ncbi:MAG: type VI secretion system baseplate subunit TssE [Desulfobacteraceae bacterium]|nr:type VI secretion system baseplate subunit TssE [Desulfobacteraceae bacterium]